MIHSYLPPKLAKSTDDPSSDRYAFLLEWFDTNAQLAREYQLFVYPADNSVEMYDIKNRRTFLKRTRHPQSNLNLAEFKIGATVSIFARSLVIKEWADTFTKKKLGQKDQRALLILSASPSNCLGKILNELSTPPYSMTLSKIRLVNISTKAAAEFAELSQDRDVSRIIGGHMFVVELNNIGSSEILKSVLGNTSDSMQSKTYFSTSASLVDKQLGYFFGESSMLRFPRLATSADCTMCVIKPWAVQNGLSGKIFDSIVSAGYIITDLSTFSLNRYDAETFLEIYKGVLPEYKNMIEEFSAGTSIAIELRHPKYNHETSPSIVSAFRNLCGPYDFELAKTLKPDTLRAKFGSKESKCVIHCTDLEEDAVLESQFFFKILSAS